jgi:Holliday junction resolvase RusA-like endonuclease
LNRLILSAIFPGEPQAWQRVTLRGPYMRKPKETRAAQKRLCTQLAQVAPKLEPNAAARFGVQLVFRTTSSQKDGDNCEKLVLDAFQGKIWGNDNQIDQCQWKMWRVLGGEVYTHLVVYVIE